MAAANWQRSASPEVSGNEATSPRCHAAIDLHHAHVVPALTRARRIVSEIELRDPELLGNRM
jgi:hypothetical protein